MTDHRYPKSAMDAVEDVDLDGSAYVSWENDPESAFATYGDALRVSEQSVVASRTRDFRDLTSYGGGRANFQSGDFDWFRPDQSAPTKPKDIIAYARFVYRRIGLIHNAIDLMGDFACQGVRLTHPNPQIKKFYQSWFEMVQGKLVSERLGHLLFREANVPIRHYTGKVNRSRRLDMQKAVGAVEIDLKTEDPVFKKGEIPVRYTFLDPLLIKPLGGPLANISKERVLTLCLPHGLRHEIKRVIDSMERADISIRDKLSPDIIRAVETGSDIILPPDKTHMYHYKKDDWQLWADPMTYSAFEHLNLYQRLQLADKAALDGAINKIRVWKIGSLDHKIAPTPAAATTLSNILGSNVGGGSIDMVWGPDIELIETSTDVQSFLGEEKYRPTLMAIYASLGIPPTLTGTFGNSGTTNNFIALKTLVERLNYVRGIIVDFWNEQIKLVQKAMGFRTPAIVEFDIMYLEDPAAMTTLLLNMADRNIISDEFVQRHIRAVPEIENKRVNREEKLRERNDQEKVSPYHAVDKDHDLKKIYAQTGVTTPSETGVELEERKEGEKSMQDMRKEQTSQNKPPPGSSGPGSPGRPKNSKDAGPRKPKQFKPKTKASVELWAKKAQKTIAQVVNPIILASFKKPTVRGLTQAENEALERVKFEVLCNLNVEDTVNEETVMAAISDPPKDIHPQFHVWLIDATEALGKLSRDQIRDLQASFYANYKYGDLS